jgi:hypothetical protein
VKEGMDLTVSVEEGRKVNGLSCWKTDKDVRLISLYVDAVEGYSTAKIIT